MEDPTYDPIQSLKEQGIKICRIPAHLKKWRWSSKEEELYVHFLVQNKDLFGKNQNLKKNRAFKKMSKCLTKRNATQCRTHHQKMLIKYGSLQNIILSIVQNITNKNEIDIIVQPFERKRKQETLKLLSDNKNKQQNFFFKQKAIPDLISEINLDIQQSINEIIWTQPSNKVLQNEKQCQIIEQATKKDFQQIQQSNEEYFQQENQ